jgi:hypothetical protein
VREINRDFFAEAIIEADGVSTHSNGSYMHTMSQKQNRAGKIPNGNSENEEKPLFGASE